ncbi:MAG: PAS domain-containing protein [Epsilonproteobacteria bacterium]|nr:PAS domain-containing protein [Campylobacterota bacterium]
MHHLIALDIEYTYTKNLIYEIDKNGIITFANSNFAEVTGFRKNELIGKNHRVFKHPDVPETIYEKLWSTEKRLKKWFSTLKNIRRDGTYFWSNIHCTAKYDESNELVGFIVVHKPASKIDIEEEIEHYAQYD